MVATEPTLPNSKLRLKLAECAAGLGRGMAPRRRRHGAFGAQLYYLQHAARRRKRGNDRAPHGGEAAEVRRRHDIM